MNVYAIFGTNNAAALDTCIPAVFPQSLKLASGQWLVAHISLLPNEVYEALKTSSAYEAVKANGADLFCIVAGMNRYYGWNDKAIWDWIENAARA